MIAFVTFCLELLFALGLKWGLFCIGLNVGYLTCLLFVVLYVSMNRLSTFIGMMDVKKIEKEIKK